MDKPPRRNAGRAGLSTAGGTTNADTTSVLSKTTMPGKKSMMDSQISTVSPMRNKQAGKRGFVAPHEAEKNILKVIEWHRSLKEPIPFGMSEKI